jgi:hypothetical protein
LLPSLRIIDRAQPDPALREITRAIRRICLLQETGRESEAAEFQPNVLQPLLDRFREARGDESLPPGRVDELFAGERARIEDAAALGEVLAPLLLARLDSRTLAAPVGLSGPENHAPAKPSRRPPTGSNAEIADFLDDMIAQGVRESAARLPSR